MPGGAAEWIREAQGRKASGPPREVFVAVIDQAFE
jgi:hypothetical protein